MFLFFFFFNDTATTEIYTLSLHDALPILWAVAKKQIRLSSHILFFPLAVYGIDSTVSALAAPQEIHARSEEHTSELQSPCNLVCRLLLEKKKRTSIPPASCRSSRTGPPTS